MDARHLQLRQRKPRESHEKGEGIAVKADKDTSYDIVHDVLDNLQTLKMNRFSIRTALKTEQD